MSRIRDDAKLLSMMRMGWTILFAGVLATGGGIAVAQDATPEASSESGVDVVLENTEGDEVGTASFTESNDAVTILVDVNGLPPGDHGIHIHETGICDASGDEPFSSAGDHFNPTGAMHGPGPSGAATPGAGTPVAADEEPSHAGDLGNIMVAEDGTGTLEIATDRVTLASGEENSLADDDGSALVVHEDPDDLMTDPSGNSGARIACGIIFPPTNGTPAASPAASDVEGEAGTVTDEPVEALDSLVFAPAMITASPGDVIEATNVGALEHDFVVDELGIDVDLPNGEVVEIQIPEDAEPGEYMFYCSVPGHEDAGMVGTLIIE